MIANSVFRGLATMASEGLSVLVRVWSARGPRNDENRHAKTKVNKRRKPLCYNGIRRPGRQCRNPPKPSVLP